jgi:hypothetical protein
MDNRPLSTLLPLLRNPKAYMIEGFYELYLAAITARDDITSELKSTGVGLENVERKMDDRIDRFLVHFFKCVAYQSLPDDLSHTLDFHVRAIESYVARFVRGGQNYEANRVGVIEVVTEPQDQARPYKLLSTLAQKIEKLQPGLKVADYEVNQLVSACAFCSVVIRKLIMEKSIFSIPLSDRDAPPDGDDYSTDTDASDGSGAEVVLARVERGPLQHQQKVRTTTPPISRVVSVCAPKKKKNGKIEKKTSRKGRREINTESKAAQLASIMLRSFGPFVQMDGEGDPQADSDETLL